jgi:hypothetical protein
MSKRNPVSSSAPSLMLDPLRRSFLSISPVILAALLAHISPPLPIKPQIRFRSEGSPKTSYHLIETRPRLPHGSCLIESWTRFFENLISLPRPRNESVTRRDRAAVILNWSRFNNVRRIVSLLCGPELEPIMKHILVWNNNPKPLNYLVR